MAQRISGSAAHPRHQNIERWTFLAFWQHFDIYKVDIYRLQTHFTPDCRDASAPFSAMHARTE